MRSQQLRPCKSPRFDGFAIGWSKRRNRKSNRPRETRPLIASDSAARKRLLPLRIFGRLPGTGARGCTEAGVRKASREETAGGGRTDAGVDLWGFGVGA